MREYDNNNIINSIIPPFPPGFQAKLGPFEININLPVFLPLLFFSFFLIKEGGQEIDCKMAQLGHSDGVGTGGVWR